MTNFMNTEILACLTCAKNFAGTSGNAAGWSIMFMLVVVLLMMGTVAFCMVRIARRSKLDPELEGDCDVPRELSSAP